MQPTPRRSKVPLFSRLFLLAYGLLVGWAIYHFMILPSGSFSWDQATHSVIGSLIAQDILDGNWLAFIYDLYRQVYWPPVHAGLLGIAFALGGITPVTARLLSLFLFLGSAFLLYLAGHKLGANRGYQVAFISTLFFLTSPALLPFAGQVMLEMTAVFFLILSLLLFLTIDKKSSPWLHIFLGLALVATYLAKSNYGILLIISVTIELLIEARFNPKKLFTKANMSLALTIIISLAFWFAYPPKIQKTWAALVNIPFGVTDPYSIEGLLFYPQALWQSSGNWGILLLFVASLILILFKFRNRNLRFLTLLIIVQLFIAEFHQTKVDRHILPVLPAFFLCVGFVLAYQGFDFEIRGKKVRLSLLMTSAVLVYAQILLINSLRPVAPQTNQTITAAISGILADGRSSLVISTINQLNPTPPLLDYMLISGEPALNPIHSDIAMNFDQDKTIASYADRDIVPKWLAAGIQTAVKRSVQPGKLRTVYLDNSGSSYSQNPESLSQHLQELDKINNVERVIVVIPNDFKRSFIPAGTVPFKLDFIAPGLEKLGLAHISTQVFEKENTRIEIYE